MRRLRIVLAIMGMLVIVGCAARNPFIGEWTSSFADAIVNYTFDEDMTVVGHNPGYAQRWGTYKYNEKELTIMWKDGGAETYPYTFGAGGTMGENLLTFYPSLDAQYRISLLSMSK